MPIDWPSSTGNGDRAEIEHDVMGVVVLARFGHANIANDRRAYRSRRRFRSIEVGVRTGGGPGRNHRGIGADLERCFLVCSVRLSLRGRADCERFSGRVGTAKFFRAQFRRQSVPAELRLDAVSPNARHRSPIVNAAGRAGRNAGHAEIADVRVDDVVARVMRDRADRAGRLAGIAADADFGVDQVLPDDLGRGRFHHTRFQSNAAFSPLP